MKFGIVIGRVNLRSVKIFPLVQICHKYDFANNVLFSILPFYFFSFIKKLLLFWFFFSIKIYLCYLYKKNANEFEKIKEKLNFNFKLIFTSLYLTSISFKGLKENYMSFSIPISLVFFKTFCHIIINLYHYNTMWFLPSALNVIMKKFVQARVNGGSNYDSLNVAKCLVI